MSCEVKGIGAEKVNDEGGDTVGGREGKEGAAETGERAKDCVRDESVHLSTCVGWKVNLGKESVGNATWQGTENGGLRR